MAAGSLWIVRDEDGRILGRFDSLEAAEKFAGRQIGRGGQVVLDDYAKECKGITPRPTGSSAPGEDSGA